MFRYSPSLQKTEKEAIMTSGLSQNTPDEVVGQDESPKQGPIMFCTFKAPVLDVRPMTWLDRIHKLGSEIRASAAATVPRFGQNLLPAERERSTNEERVGQLQDQDQQESQQQQQQRARMLSKTELSFTSFRTRSFTNVTGIAKRKSEAMHPANSVDFTNAKALANEPAPVPRGTLLTTDTRGWTSPLLHQQHAPGSKRDECLGEAAEDLSPDMGFLADIEKEIQDLADF
ncbi:hypothetical protein BG015_000416 [Linnemannia schmuckeri]|uniref:Uncharacterized protein n=1 Tax=Linnemannia schmuckeri TaxID=64567 RepID=A0A9P5RTV7_9FUNG|nr:hypothetical protein BG015_000416 [Linnemannia schmuckeri]